MPGAEPAQGALADVYVNFGAVDADFKRSAWQLVRARLAAHHARFFDAQTDQAPLPVIHPLATRWSVLARSSADISTRARRCSGDDSRALAADMVAAVERADVQAQQAFLHHCITCHDNLAFMLVRRALQHSGAQPPLHWDAVSLQLQHAQGVA
jgi:mono/diheme cytochrome c family protein